MDCAICLDIIDKKYKPDFVKCNHFSFHKECLDSWVKRNRSCPICRKNYNLSNKEKFTPYCSRLDNSILKITFPNTDNLNLDKNIPEKYYPCDGGSSQAYMSRLDNVKLNLCFALYPESSQPSGSYSKTS